MQRRPQQRSGLRKFALEPHWLAKKIQVNVDSIFRSISSSLHEYFVQWNKRSGFTGKSFLRDVGAPASRLASIDLKKERCDPGMPNVTDKVAGFHSPGPLFTPAIAFDNVVLKDTSHK